jgi:alcohol dehydrogenase class IV
MGGILSIPHGVACANLLPSAVRATIDNLTGINTAPSNITMDKFARIGRLFGANHDDRLDCCRYLVDCLYQWLDQLDIPRLGQFGLTAAHVDFLVRAASNKNNPWPLSDSQIGQMIQDRC